VQKIYKLALLFCGTAGDVKALNVLSVGPFSSEDVQVLYVAEFLGMLEY